MNSDGSYVDVKGVSWTNVTLTIEDLDDNPPMFGLSQYIATVYEEMTAGIPINIEEVFINITDIDQVRSSDCHELGFDK